MSPEQLSIEKERELERTLAQANLQRMRKQWSDAQDTLRRASEIAPKDVVVLEMLGDVLYECGKLDEAAKEYQKALELSPRKPSLEKKYAKMVLELGNRDYERALAKDMLENPNKYVTRTRKPGLALILALVLPGLGQFYNQEFIKAGIIIGTILLFALSWLLQTPYSPATYSLADFIQQTNPVVLVLGFLALMAYIYGIVDAPLSAEKSSKAAEKASKQSEV